ncbi:Polyketide cyclase/dehydrase and lipid transport superfamily protein isoform 2 [Hibiscus syriacus]|uniref:Polyketide cyclase/dehydrase and lipid transport superfamily protein isoform 2 n=1 Tax=Hibiscus syriacus TaxID=106335 RepID=A0A6A2Z3A5_HIBSY|nr:Polyketide cyclase/dehydrase and lipid transport superfamily protein isoform 2 [Hibiscus syriacus]
MDETLFDLMEFLKKPTITETFVDILLCAVPIWLAVMIGLVIGWSWRPRWTSLVFLGLRSKFRFIWTAPSGFGARRLGSLSLLLPARKSTSGASNSAVPLQPSSPTVRVSPEGAAGTVRIVGEEIDWVFIQRYFPSANVIYSLKAYSKGSSSKAEERQQDIVTENDLAHLLYLLKGKEGEMEWQHMMEKTTPNMSYQAWRHEPEVAL